MALPPKLKRLPSDAFEDAPEWFLDVFLPAFNEFTTQVTNALNGGLTAPENVSSYIEQKVRVVTTSVAGEGFPLIIANRLGRIPLCVVIASLELISGSPISSAVSVLWSVTGDGRLKINALPGLPLSSEFRVAFKVE